MTRGFSGLLRLSLCAALALAFPAALPGADKPETWLEVRSPHFTVYSNAGEKQARRIADQFEQFRALLLKTLVKVRVDPGQPMLILAAKNEASLRALLPEYWERKGFAHPTGVFIPGAEKNYVALRVDAEGDRPYVTLYHEYFHLVVRLNHRTMPAWLNEGYADFFGNATIGDKEARIGQPSPSYVQLLRETRLLPLDVLFQVTHDSPYYTGESTATVFYAESWALVHYFMLDPQASKSRPLGAYLTHVLNGVPDPEAARRAFGDLKKLQEKLEGYVRLGRFYEYRVKYPAELTEKDFQVRASTPAESAALRGDFHMQVGRMAEARSLLEEAIQLDPKLASAHESLGMLELRLDNREAAAVQFAKAVELDSRSYLAHYLYAQFLMKGAPLGQPPPEAEPSLQRAIHLKPDFPPAYAALSALYSMRPETLEKALAAAQTAANLAPGEPFYQLNLGYALARMRRFSEAREIARSLLAAANKPEDRAAAQNFLAALTEQEQISAFREREAREREAARQELQKVLAESQAAKNPPATPAAATASAPSAPAPLAKPARLYSMFGTITEVSCSSPPLMEFTLSQGGITMRLHAANHFKVDYLTTSWKPPANFNPCVHLKGQPAKVSYTLVHGQKYDGEIVSIEVGKRPL